MLGEQMRALSECWCGTKASIVRMLMWNRGEHCQNADVEQRRALSECWCGTEASVFRMWKEQRRAFSECGRNRGERFQNMFVVTEQASLFRMLMWSMGDRLQGPHFYQCASSQIHFLQGSLFEVDCMWHILRLTSVLCSVADLTFVVGI